MTNFSSCIGGSSRILSTCVGAIPRDLKRISCHSVLLIRSWPSKEWVLLPYKTRRQDLAIIVSRTATTPKEAVGVGVALLIHYSATWATVS